MQTNNSRFALWIGAFALAIVVVPGATAQCGISMKTFKP